MNRRSLTIFELLIVACVIFILIGGFAIYANTTLRYAREVALQNELSNMRLSIEHFRIINGRAPDNLEELLTQGLTSKYTNSKMARNVFLEPFRLNKEGYLADPFMQRYVYDSQNGTIHSQTKGYERW